ncbi:hypothetical protein [Pseudonocardia sp.]|jgi:hypothetical protein|uniref:hypothetical protein n=1 Tax=Pseudonocardia sp. TaxID=60912 RepID=UPI002D8AABB4|nr:hypothetical protein [Pseudonocardia sp.]
MISAATLRRLPVRLTAGAYILNSGLQKWSADEQTAGALHGMASNAYPVLKQVDPPMFLRGLAAAEIGLGAALVLPAVPALLAGAGLTAFSAGLLGLFVRTPGMREEGSLRPSQQGIPFAKDVWLLGIGVGLVVDALTSRE